ncbi:MAG: hypothetical protein ACYSW4_02590 [Planctomycetota bacterium]
MKTKRYYFILAVAIGILCAPAWGELEVPRYDEPVLLGQPNPALAGISELYVIIEPPDAEPNKDGLVWEALDEKVKLRLKEAGIKTASVHRIGGKRTKPPGFPIPDLRVCVDMLKLADSQQYVFYIRTSLVSKVSLLKEPRRYIVADVWKIEPAMEAIPAQIMPAKVTEVVLEQVEAFIICYLVANPDGVQPADANSVSAALKEQAKPTVKPAAAKYKYVASKRSSVFHGLDCGWAERISPKNLVSYNSRDEAIRAAKRPCKRCKP